MRHHRWRFLKPPPGPPLVLQPLQHVPAKVPLGLAPQIEAGHLPALDLAAPDPSPGGATPSPVPPAASAAHDPTGQGGGGNGPAEASSPTLSNNAIQQVIKRHEARMEKRDEQLSRRIETLTARLVKLGAPISGVDLGGDPRGVCVKLIRTDGRSNSWGGESRWCVPLEG